MLDFLPLTLNDIPKLRPFFLHSNTRLCDTTLGTAFLWRNMYHTQYAVHGESLYFKVDYPGLGETFTLPLGGSRQEHYRQIAFYCCRRGIPISFYPIPAEELPELQDFFPNSAAIPNRDTADYLYRAEDLKYFRGKKLNGQRNHVNRFLKTYGNWSFRTIQEEDIPALKQFVSRYAARQEKAALTFHEDIAKTIEVLDNYRLYDFLGGVLLADGQIAGFSLNEILADTMYTHIEKADRDFPGSYQMLVSQTARSFAGTQVQFINREDDAGDPGLRTSKLSYHPLSLLDKYTVTIVDPCSTCV